MIITFLKVLAAVADAPATGGLLGGIPAGLWAVIGTIIGTIGLKVVEGWLNRNKDSSDIRRNFNVEIGELQTRLDKVEEEVTFWRSKFYEQQESAERLRIMLIKAGVEPPQRVIVQPNRAD